MSRKRTRGFSNEFAVGAVAKQRGIARGRTKKVSDYWPCFARIPSLAQLANQPGSRRRAKLAFSQLLDHRPKPRRQPGLQILVPQPETPPSRLRSRRYAA